MKNISKLLYSVFSLLLLFNLTACFTAYNTNVEDDLVALSVNAGTEAFRTILPTSSSFYSMASYKLTGKKQTAAATSTTSAKYDSEVTIKTWTSYSDLIATKEIFCKQGVWCFNLYSYDKNGTQTYSGSITDFSVTSTSDSRVLNFKMKALNSYGSLSVTMYFPVDESIKGVKGYVTTTVGGSKSYTSTLKKSSGTGSNANKNYVTYTPTSTLAAGTYYVCFDFYSDTNCTNLVQTNRELVNIYGGETSTAVREISHINHVYNIYYILNGGGYNSTEKIILTFTEYDNVTLKNPTRTGFTFGGWYLTSACTGDPVTGWSNGTYNSDVTLYAKWN